MILKTVIAGRFALWAFSWNLVLFKATTNFTKAAISGILKMRNAAVRTNIVILSVARLQRKSNQILQTNKRKLRWGMLKPACKLWSNQALWHTRYWHMTWWWSSCRLASCSCWWWWWKWLWWSLALNVQENIWPGRYFTKETGLRKCCQRHHYQGYSLLNSST